jgi:hypothetical protein
MMLPPPSLSCVPSGTPAVLDLTADFAPLLKMGLSVSLCTLIFAVVTAIYDTWWEPRKPRKRKTA